jgi:hypothetical protein
MCPLPPSSCAAALLLLRMQQAREEAEEAKHRSCQVGVDVLLFSLPACQPARRSRLASC